MYRSEREAHGEIQQLALEPFPDGAPGSAASGVLGKGVHTDDASLRVNSKEGGNKARNESRNVVVVVCCRLLALGLWHVLANLKEIVRIILRDDDIFFSPILENIPLGGERHHTPYSTQMS